MTVVYCDNKSCKFNLVGEICQKEHLKIVHRIIDIDVEIWDETNECKSEELNELPLE